MLRAYFDDTGKDGALGVGGCIGEVEAWDKFAQEWEAVLRDFDVAWFHATDFEAGQREFISWKNDKAKRHRFRTSLVDVLNQHAICHIGSVIPAGVIRPKPWPSRSQKLPKEELWEQEWTALELDAYCVCLSRCMAQAATVAAERREQIHLVLAYQAGETGRAAKLFEVAQRIEPFGESFVKITQGPSQNPRQVVQLQGADLVAYELVQRKLNRRRRYRNLARPAFVREDSMRLFAGWLV